ncbi:MAG: hypothetical protein E7C13_06780 [Actinomyces sp.]|nr:hypothetical protein [Actinomyces sp.]
MIDTTQPQPKKPSNPAKSLTIICSVLAVILLLTSTTMYLSARSKAQEIEDTWDAAQSTDTKAMELDSEIKSIESQIDEAKAKKDAQKWCDGLTRENAELDKLRTQANALKSMAQNKRDAIDSLCPQKKAFVEAVTKDAKEGMLGPEDMQCVINGNTMTFNATIKINAPSVLALGDMDVTVEAFAADHPITDSDASIGSTVVSVSSSGTGPLSLTLPGSGNETNCALKPVRMWPTGL